MRKASKFLLEEELEEPIVNLTPLIDVVFVVLIAFMLIAPVLNIDTIQLAEGIPKKNSDLTQSTLTIRIQKDNSIWVQDKLVTLGNLTGLLKIEKQKNPTLIPTLIPDAASHFETYQKVKNSLESIGFEQLNILLKP